MTNDYGVKPVMLSKGLNLISIWSHSMIMQLSEFGTAIATYISSLWEKMSPDIDWVFTIWCWTKSEGKEPDIWKHIHSLSLYKCKQIILFLHTFSLHLSRHSMQKLNIISDISKQQKCSYLWRHTCCVFLGHPLTGRPSCQMDWHSKHQRLWHWIVSTTASATWTHSHNGTCSLVDLCL